MTYNYSSLTWGYSEKAEHCGPLEIHLNMSYMSTNGSQPPVVNNFLVIQNYIPYLFKKIPGTIILISLRPVFLCENQQNNFEILLVLQLAL